MTDSNNTGDKTITVAPKKTLGLKPRGVERDVVRQSFSHGRTNTVQVERKKRRIALPGEKIEAPAPVATPRPAPAEVASVQPARPTSAETAAARARAAGMVLRQLSTDELDARARALADAKVHEAEERRVAEEVAVRRTEEQKRLSR